MGDPTFLTRVALKNHKSIAACDVHLGSLIPAVLSEQGVTKIGPVDEAGRSALTSSLYTPGELLRLSQLVPDPASVSDLVGRQLRLFDNED